MKKILTLLIGIALVYSCSTSNDGNGNSNTAVVPLPPTSLTGSVVSTNQINLTWTDNSTNETGFKIERKTSSGTFAVVRTTVADVNTFNDTDLTPSTTYTYRVYSYNEAGISLNYSNEFTQTTSSVIILPTLNTTFATMITNTTAISGGNITSDGGAPIIERGVVWGSCFNGAPNISLSTKTIDGAGMGTFTSSITNLQPDTQYAYCAYATNSAGTSYGEVFCFKTKNFNISGPNLTDIDGNTYQTTSNCGKTWTTSNLNVSRYRNGDVIPQITSAAQWGNYTTTGAWCYYNYDPANAAIYGKLYNWFAVTDPRGLAPAGYHIPSKTEWETLIDCLGGANIAGGKLKEMGTTHWTSPNTGADNSSGLTCLPGGNVVISSYDIGNSGFFWSSSAAQGFNGNAAGHAFTIKYNNANATNVAGGAVNLFSVRCIKD